MKSAIGLCTILLISFFSELIGEQKSASKSGNDHVNKNETERIGSGAGRNPQQVKNIQRVTKGSETGNGVRMPKLGPRSSEVNPHILSDTRSQYNWIKRTDLNKREFSNTKINFVNRRTTSHLAEEQLKVAAVDFLKSKTNVSSQKATNKQPNRTESTLNMRDDKKDEAVQFLKEKLSKRKVYINKHHATFRNIDLATCSELKETATVKQDKTDSRKSAAVQFLKENGVGTNTEAVSSTPGASKAMLGKNNTNIKYNKQNYKLDHRPHKLSTVGPKELQPSKEHEARNLVSQTRHKLVRRPVSQTPQNKAYDTYPKQEMLKSESLCSKGKHSSFKHVRSTSRCGASSNSTEQVNRYKLVKNKKSSSPQTTGSHTAKAPKNIFISSKYKLVKKAESSDVQQTAPLLNTKPKPISMHKRKRHSVSKYRWTKLESKVTQRQQSSLAPIEKPPPVVPHVVNTPRGIKMKTRFKLVRKALKTTQGKLLALEKKPTTPSRCIKKSKYKLINKEQDSRVPLVWKNRFSLKRNNAAGISKSKYILCVQYTCTWHQLN